MSGNEKGTQSRRFQLTINNPNDKEITHDVIKKNLLKSKSLIYYCMADEIGENNTPHTHIYSVYRSPVYFNTIKKLFPTAHIENAHGSSAQNRAYILKEGEEYKDKAETSIEGTFEEWGEIPVDGIQGFRSDLDLMYKLIKSGLSTNEIIEINPEYIKYITSIEKVRQMLLQEENKEIFRNLEVTYIYGTTGTGKTRYVMEKEGYSAVYRITDYLHLWDSYKQEDIVLFDEYASSVKIVDMNNYLDGYPLELPCRYANKRALYTKVYLISNLGLRNQYPNVQQENITIWEAFLRRIHKVIVFNNKRQYIEYGREEYMQSTVSFGLETVNEIYPFGDSEKRENIQIEL